MEVFSNVLGGTTDGSDIPIINDESATAFGRNDVNAIIDDLNNALDRIDNLGLTHAGALLSRVLDSLTSIVSDLPGSGRAIQS
jgi:hypothetical protein